MNKFFFLLLFVSPIIVFASHTEDGYECDNEDSSESDEIEEEVEATLKDKPAIIYEYVDLDDELAKQMANHLFKHQGIDEQLDTLINDYCGLKTIFKKIFGKKRN